MYCDDCNFRGTIVCEYCSYDVSEKLLFDIVEPENDEDDEDGIYPAPETEEIPF